MLQLYDKYTLAIGEMPYEPDFRQVTYIDNGALHFLNQFVRDHLAELKEVFWKEGLEFCYVSRDFFFDTENLEEQILYRVPWLEKGTDYETIERLKTLSLEEMRKTFQSAEGKDNVFYLGDQEKIVMKVDVRMEKQYMIQFHMIASEYGRALKERFDEEYGADIAMRRLIYKLGKKEPKGVVRKVLEDALAKQEPVISRVRLHRSCDVELLDYGKTIHLTPMEMTLFCLFINHEEGIALKDIVDYKKELTNIYSHFSKHGDPAKIAGTIDRLLEDPDEKNTQRSRLKGAFVNEIDKEVAQNYYITGKAGDTMRITLPRDKVEGDLRF